MALGIGGARSPPGSWRPTTDPGPRSNTDGGLASPLALRIVPSVIARGPVRAAEKTAVLARPGSQPATTRGTCLNRFTAVAAAEPACRLDRQSLATGRARRLRVLAVGPVRAIVDGAPVLRLLPAHKMPPGRTSDTAPPCPAIARRLPRSSSPRSVQARRVTARHHPPGRRHGVSPGSRRHSTGATSWRWDACQALRGPGRGAGRRRSPSETRVVPRYRVFPIQRTSPITSDPCHWTGAD